MKSRIRFALAAAALLALALGAQTATAQKPLSGSIAVDTTLDHVGGAIYHVNGNVTVETGVTLTIEPGVCLKFDAGRYLTVRGTLLAEGGSSPDSTIVFTSILDDQAPLNAPDDTNGDGAATTPASGDWTFLQFYGTGSSGSSLRWCLVRYAGYSGNHAIQAQLGAAPLLRACDLAESHGGVRILDSSAPTLRNCSFQDLETVPVSLELTAAPVFDNLIIDLPSGNGHDAIRITEGATPATATIAAATATVGGSAVDCLAYWVTDNIDVGVGDVLDIEPGVCLKFDPNRHVEVAGRLNALGGPAVEERITFTSIDDDNAPEPEGQDTNTNGNDTFPDQADWGGIRFLDTASDLSELRYCDVHFAGYHGASCGAVDCQDASPRLVECDLTSAHYGIRCTGDSSPLLSNTTINAMQDVPIAIELDTNPVFDNVVFESTSDNGFDAIGILGGTMVGSNALRIRGAQLGPTPIENLVYILLADITVDVAAELTIDPGIVAKPRSNVDLVVDGALYMDGKAEPDSQIVFTSYKDDAYGTPNDTNNDGSITSPDKNDWGRIVFHDDAIGSISHATVRFGGYSNRPVIDVESASPDLHDLIISDVPYGIGQAGNSSSTITDVAISNTTYTPVLMSISADPVYANITFTNVGCRAIGLVGETIGIDSVLRVREMSGYENITYYLAGNVTMAEGAQLRIEPGIVLKMETGGYGYDFYIDGSLQAVGTVDSTIVFTGIKDDTRGNPLDTAGDGANTPAASQWGHVKFGPTSVDAQCVLERCLFSYGGYGYSSQPDAVVWCNSASPLIRDNEFVTNNIGVWTDGNSMPVIQDNSFFNHTSTPLATSVIAAPQYVGNSFDQNGIHAVGLIDETLNDSALLEKISMAGLDPYPYYNLGTTTVGTGNTLTIEPGVLVKARANSTVISVAGALQAVGGPADDRIFFTSIKDDSAGGDSNVDGSDSSPESGDWNGIDFEASADGAASLVRNCVFSFAGLYYVIGIDSCDPTLRDNEFELCDYGLRLLNTAAPVIQDNLFRVITWYPIEKSVLAQPVFSGNMLDNVNYPALAIRGENIGQDMTMGKWDFAGYTNITQVLAGTTLTVELGATLTIEPGVVLKMNDAYNTPFGQILRVYGGLTADGTATDPIVFTSTKDDSVGNPADTNSDGAGSAPAAGDWEYIQYEEVSDDAACVLDHCQVRYGHSGTSGYGMVWMTSAAPTVSHCDFLAAGHGLGLYGSSQPVISDCTFDGMLSTPIRMSLIAAPVFGGNHFLAGNRYLALGIHGETLAQDVTIPARDMAQTARIPYVLLGDVTAGYSSILTIEPGVVIKGTGAVIRVRRGLIAEGTADPEGMIVFTSVTDDFYGGDTNNDGEETEPGSTRWGRIIIDNEVIDDSTRLSNVVFRYGYNNASDGTIAINSANPEFDDCVFAYNGIALDYRGTAGDPAEGWIHGCDFYGNNYYAVRNEAAAFTVDATGNWWGHASGPLDVSDDTGSGGFYNPSGLGDAVSDHVDYGSWLVDGIENLLLGDVSRNGDIRAYDASLILQHLVGPFLGPLQLVLADVDCTSTVTSVDAVQILFLLSGSITYFPCAYESVPTKEVEPEAPALAPITFEVELPEVQLAPGESQWVPVQLTGDGDLYGQEYHIRFDPQQVQVDAVRLLPGAVGSMMAWNVLDGDELRIAAASAEALPVADAVEFRVTAATGVDPGESARLMLTFARLNDQEHIGASDAPGAPGAVRTLRLLQNRPNPFNPQTVIRYELPDGAGETPVRLAIYDPRGRRVRLLVDEVRQPGPYEVVWDGRDEAGRRAGSGVFLYRLEVGEKQLVRKMILLK